MVLSTASAGAGDAAVLVETDQLHDFLEGKTVEAADLYAQNAALRDVVEAQNQIIAALRAALGQQQQQLQQQQGKMVVETTTAREQEIINRRLLDAEAGHHHSVAGTTLKEAVIDGLKLVDDDNKNAAAAAANVDDYYYYHDETTDDDMETDSMTSNPDSIEIMRTSFHKDTAATCCRPRQTLFRDAFLFHLNEERQIATTTGAIKHQMPIAITTTTAEEKCTKMNSKSENGRALSIEMALYTSVIQLAASRQSSSGERSETTTTSEKNK